MNEKEEKKIKICLVIPSLQSGGMERAMSELASCFAEKKEAELHLVLYGKSREAFYTVPESVSIHRPHWPFNNNRRLLSTLRTLSWLRRTGIEFCNFPALVDDRLRGIPVITV